jgi:hypothetical protein
MAEPATVAVNRSAALSGASDTIFTVAPWGSIQERGIFNASAHDMWWSPFGPAAANAAGSFKLAAGEGMVLRMVNAITIIGTAADNVSAWER